VDYYGVSFLKHLEIAKGLSVEVFDSFNLSTDIDEVSDLAELLIHGKGHSRSYLEKIGARLLANKGRVGVELRRQ
jgi:2-phospho-L-lactate guanylyltransferase